MKTKRNRVYKMIPATLLATTLAVSSAHAGFFDRGMHHGGDMLMPIERMIEHIDLTDMQEQQAEKILDNARKEAGNLKQLRHQFAKKIMMNNPDNANYTELAEEHADTIASEVKNKILLMSKVRQDIYQILTPEQKQDLERHIEKRMQRMSMKKDHRRFDD